MNGSTRQPPDGWTRLEALFREALERPPGEREAFLEGLPPADAGLRAELESLLAAHEAPGGSGFLERLDPDKAGALLNRPGGGAGPSPGDAVGPYRILRRLGGGGMGVVYLAEDGRLDRKVALKFLPAWLSADPGAQRRFTMEAKAASALDHPNIATIYAIDRTSDGRLYIAMAYYEGETLAERIDQGPLEVAEAVEIAAQLAAGLGAAHARGIVHRDVKPGNVMVTTDGVAKILDFGIAKVSGRALTQTGTTLGTAAYMSPEQTRGEEVDARSDLWSLGVLLYEMLAGRRPFRASGADALIFQIRHDEPEPLGAARPEVPERVAAAVGRCLRKDPAERPASAHELAGELRGERPGERTGEPGDRGSRSRQAAAGPLPSLRGRGPRAWVAAFVVVAVLVAAYSVWNLIPDSGTGAASGPERSIAVLPFENLSGTEDAEPYARGIHDEVLTRLSGISGLKVISRRAVEPYRDSDQPTGTIASDLGVQWILEGGVAKRGEQIQVTARLVDPVTDTQAWADSYQRDLTAPDLFAIQGEITTEIAHSLQARLSPAERERLARRPTDDLEAYRFYVEGRTHLDQRGESGLRQAMALFGRAIELDSTYSNAWAGLADATTLLAYYGHAPRDSLLPKALRAAEQALSLDPDLAEARASVGLIHQSLRHDGPLALRELRRAVELEPSYAQAHQWLGNLLLTLGHLEEAGASLRRAAELDPTSPAIRVALSRWYQYTGDWEAALDQARTAEDLSPSYPSALMLTGEALRGMGRLEEAREVFRRALEIPGVNPQGYPGIWVELALVHRTLGDTAKARELVERLEAETPPFVQAGVMAGMGRRDTALALLQAGPMIPDLAVILRYQRVFDDLRADPRFRELLRAYDRAWGLDPDSTTRVEGL